MNKEYKCTNNSHREHFKLFGYLPPAVIEELLEKVEELEAEVSRLESDVQDENEQAYYWKMKYETLN